MLQSLFIKYKEALLYLFFGALTTLVNIVTYYLFFDLLNVTNVISTVVAQFFAIIFAYVTNKMWVFNSKSWQLKTISFEIFSFFGCRLTSAAFDVIFMWVSVDILSLWPILMKVVANVIVVVLNYFASKLLIFK